MTNKNNITGIILAGGKSSRMGTDKGVIEFNNKPFIQYSIDALKPLVSEIIIISDNPDYDVFGLKRITDVTKNSGPVAGISSGLKASITPFNLVLSCDIPLITTEVLKKLINAIDDTSEIIQAESKGKSMPLIALYRKDLETKFNIFLNQDERRLRVAVNACKVKNIILNESEEFTTMNVNSPNELKTIIDANSY